MLNHFKICLVGVFALSFLSGCSHSKKRTFEDVRPKSDTLKAVAVKDPVLLRLKAEMGRAEKVSYTHRATSKAYEDQELRYEKTDALDFTSQADTIKVIPATDKEVSVFTQSLSIVKKEGNADLRDFAMPEMGERLEVTADALGKILKSGDYPENSVFYVSPISLPKNPVTVGDTWTMEAAWLSLDEMVPYQLQMVTILKGFWTCGNDTCAELEISGDVGFQGPLNNALVFKSTWRGRIYFALNAGTVVWSRTDSEERLVSDRVRRDVMSCLEAVLIEPNDVQLPGLQGERCQALQSSDTETAKN